MTPATKIAAPIPSAEAKNNPFLLLFTAIKIHLTQKRCRAEQKRLVWGARGAGKERCGQIAWLWRHGTARQTEQLSPRTLLAGPCWKHNRG